MKSVAVLADVAAIQWPPEPHEEYILGLSTPLLDQLPVGVYVCARDGAIVRFNRRAAELWGRSPRPGDPLERFCGSFRLYHMDGGPIAHAECEMAGVLAGGAPVRNAEIVMERPDGSSIIALLHIDPLIDDGGKIAGAVCCFRDVTDHRGLQGKLHEKDRHSHQLLEALPIAVYTTDAAGRITSCNEAAIEMWGRSPVLGQDLRCGSWRLHWPDGRPMEHDECPMALALREGRPVRGVEAVAERPDGTRVPFLSYPTPLFDSSGKLIGAVNALVDISIHKHAIETAQRLAAIVESSDDAVISKDLNGNIVSWNRGAERLFGYLPDEVIGKSVLLLIPPDRRNEEDEILGRIRQGARVDHFETVRRRKDGSLVDISLTVSPVKDARGIIVGASKIARDITERRRARDQEKLLLREMNHRVKNLFALAGSIVSLSTRSARSVQELAAAVSNRLGALSSAQSLTLPDVAGEPGSEGKATSLDALARTIVSPYDIADHAHGFRVTLDGPDVMVRGNAVTALALVLNEFAANAAKYGAFSRPEGQVTIDWIVEEDELCLSWSEHGGPPLTGEAESQGFGSVLSRATIEGQFRGRIARDWRPEGLRILLRVPMDSLTK